MCRVDTVDLSKHWLMFIQSGQSYTFENAYDISIKLYRCIVALQISLRSVSIKPPYRSDYLNLSIPESIPTQRNLHFRKTHTSHHGQRTQFIGKKQEFLSKRFIFCLIRMKIQISTTTSTFLLLFKFILLLSFHHYRNGSLPCGSWNAKNHQSLFGANRKTARCCCSNNEEDGTTV